MLFALPTDFLLLPPIISASFLHYFWSFIVASFSKASVVLKMSGDEPRIDSNAITGYKKDNCPDLSTNKDANFKIDLAKEG